MWLLLLLVAAHGSPGLPLEVRVDGKPAPGFGVKYFNGEEMLHAVTDSRGVAVLAMKTVSVWDAWPESRDYVFGEVRRRPRWQADAVRSATWRRRQHPRPCDAWRDILDITRGTLETESAAHYDEWYASLTPQERQNCVTLSAIEARVGSKAPWFLYELEGLPPACVGGKYVGELDWAAWYRGLLEEATGASPGKCLSDWKRWWAAKGYPPVPQRPRVESD